ncbi:hypothetical protein JHN61_05595 [Streptomyces sp. MBT67]|uniref:PPA1309 family protein n=1 Tax=unclassified Streptomyces TaxID=2593676 RepID=UPI00190D1F4F|nr:MULTISPECIES: PPA1309 family protein [unclassified Streptomyces]MBK3529851.1 hypothetical protein [Streptomyces sp. MBT72]MBK3535685.1 hypothetical protein [Streptomyces sp. MBT67]MBK3550998.1 hypothetical protein [Streptomyces sp. MBT61]MBK6027725.1 hypothetical protein [Streptomyces sp. MBT59]
MSNSSDLTAASGRSGAASLTRTAMEIDEFSADRGWDEPAQLYALVTTAQIHETNPQLASQLGLDRSETSLNPVAQEEIPPGMELDRFLGTISWPGHIAGCAVVVEQDALPSGAPVQPSDQTVRIIAAVLRDGSREVVLRLREKNAAGEVLTGPGLAPELTDALLASLA